MFEEMTDSEVGAFAADLFDGSGIETHVWDRGDRVYVGLERAEPSYRRALVWALADPGRPVGEAAVRSFAERCEREGVADATLLTTGEVTPAARQVAERNDVSVLDGDDLRQLVDEQGLDHLVRRHATSESGGLLGDARAALADLLPDEVRSALPTRGGDDDGTGGGRSAPGVPASTGLNRRRIAAAVVGVAAVALVATLLVGPAASILGLADAGPTDVAVSANDTRVRGGEGQLVVGWNAATTTTVDPNASDGVAYAAPNGTKFVVVALELVNGGTQTLRVRQSDFALRTNGTVHGYQPLANDTTFEPRSLAGGENATVATVFRVPRNVTAATLTASPGVTNRSVLFSRNPSLAVNATG